MKITFLLFVLAIVSFPGFCIYDIGEVVEDFNWMESDGGTPVEQTLYELIDQEKAVMLFFGSLG